MRIFTILLVFALTACTPAEPEIHKTSLNVDESALPALFASIDELTDTPLDIDSMIELTASVEMDDEKQETLMVSYQGHETELVYHIWREQADWVHLYMFSPSKDLIDAVSGGTKPFAREE